MRQNKGLRTNVWRVSEYMTEWREEEKKIKERYKNYWQLDWINVNLLIRLKGIIIVLSSQSSSNSVRYPHCLPFIFTKAGFNSE